MMEGKFYFNHDVSPIKHQCLGMWYTFYVLRDFNCHKVPIMVHRSMAKYWKEVE